MGLRGQGQCQGRSQGQPGGQPQGRGWLYPAYFRGIGVFLGLLFRLRGHWPQGQGHVIILFILVFYFILVKHVIYIVVPKLVFEFSRLGLGAAARLGLGLGLGYVHTPY
jgi:hypothetical protein